MYGSGKIPKSRELSHVVMDSSAAEVERYLQTTRVSSKELISALDVSIKLNRTYVFNILIENFQVNGNYSNGEMIETAISNDNYEIVSKLVNKFPKMLESICNDWTPFMMAVDSCNFKIVTFIGDSAPNTIFYETSDGISAFVIFFQMYDKYAFHNDNDNQILNYLRKISKSDPQSIRNNELRNFYLEDTEFRPTSVRRELTNRLSTNPAAARGPSIKSNKIEMIEDAPVEFTGLKLGNEPTGNVPKEFSNSNGFTRESQNSGTVTSLRGSQNAVAGNTVTSLRGSQNAVTGDTVTSLRGSQNGGTLGSLRGSQNGGTLGSLRGSQNAVTGDTVTGDTVTSLRGSQNGGTLGSLRGSQNSGTLGSLRGSQAGSQAGRLSVEERLISGSANANNFDINSDEDLSNDNRTLQDFLEEPSQNLERGIQQNVLGVSSPRGSQRSIGSLRGSAAPIAEPTFADNQGIQQNELGVSSPRGSQRSIASLRGSAGPIPEPTFSDNQGIQQNELGVSSPRGSQRSIASLRGSQGIQQNELGVSSPRGSQRSISSLRESNGGMTGFMTDNQVIQQNELGLTRGSQRSIGSLRESNSGVTGFMTDNQGIQQNELGLTRGSQRSIGSLKGSTGPVTGSMIAGSQRVKEPENNLFEFNSDVDDSVVGESVFGESDIENSSNELDSAVESEPEFNASDVDSDGEPYEETEEPPQISVTKDTDLIKLINKYQQVNSKMCDPIVSKNKTNYCARIKNRNNLVEMLQNAEDKSSETINERVKQIREVDKGLTKFNCRTGRNSDICKEKRRIKDIISKQYK